MFQEPDNSRRSIIAGSIISCWCPAPARSAPHGTEATVVFVRCTTCETIWHICERRPVYRLDADALGRFRPEEELR